MMRAITIALTILCFLSMGLSASLHAQPPTGGPCVQITAECKQAGFEANGAKMGIGLALDCIRPIIAGTQQRKQATKPLPQIDPKIVAACKAQRPNFGRGGEAQ
jgi:hypothetical protein